MADPKVEKEAGPAPGGEIEQQENVPKKREYKDFGEETHKATRKFFSFVPLFSAFGRASVRVQTSPRVHTLEEIALHFHNAFSCALNVVHVLSVHC